MTKENTNPISLLLVDDDADFIGLLALRFRAAGYEVETANCGEEAQAILAKRRFDLVISDVRMPNGDGIELLEKARSGEDVPVVLLLTGYADISSEDAISKGAAALFSKPVNFKNLQEAVKRMTQPAKPAADPCERRATLKMPSSATPFDGTVIDMGQRRMFVSSAVTSLLNIDDTVVFQIPSTPSSKEMSGTGIVRWIRTREKDEQPIGCEIEFTNVKEELPSR